MALLGLPLILPVSPHLLLARLPALVALKPPAEYPLIKLWLVILVLLLLFVVFVFVLCAVEETLVTLDLAVNVRVNLSRPSS